MSFPLGSLRWLLFTSIFLLSGANLCAQSTGQNFEFSPEVRSTYDLILQLRLDEAEDKVRQSTSLWKPLLENYIDFYKIFISEDENILSEKSSKKRERIKFYQSLKREDPYINYCIAEIYLQWALIHLKFEDNFKAANEVLKAYNFLEHNQHKFPDFQQNYKSLGVVQAILGTIPDSYKLGNLFLDILGLEGSVYKGIHSVKSLLDNSSSDYMFQDEVKIVYTYMVLHLLNDKEEAWQLINDIDLDPSMYPLFLFTKSNIAMRTGHNDTALEILSGYTYKPGVYNFYYLDFLCGLARLRKLDPNCEKYFDRFIKNFGNGNYIKEAYQKKAWCALLFGDFNTYHETLKLIPQKGRLLVDEDKFAQREAENYRIPNVSLLKSQLLFDGAYYQRSLDTLEAYKDNYLYNPKLSLEYTYRKARINHALGNFTEALVLYSEAIEKDQNGNTYFACNAALQSGRIYELQEERGKAIYYYNLCLSLPSEEYQTSLHQKAKAGISRLEKG